MFRETYNLVAGVKFIIENARRLIPFSAYEEASGRKPNSNRIAGF